MNDFELLDTLMWDDSLIIEDDGNKGKRYEKIMEIIKEDKISRERTMEDCVK
jgi:hypothetical protein